MPTEAKRETIAQLTEEARSSSAMIVSEYRGLKVSELGEIRKNLRKQNVTYHVVKNRLMKIAAAAAGNDKINPLLTGPTAIAFIKGDEGSSAKAILDAFRPYRLIKVTGGVVGEHVVSADGVTRLAAAAEQRRSSLPGCRRHCRSDVHHGRALRRPASRHRRTGAGPRRQARRIGRGPRLTHLRLTVRALRPGQQGVLNQHGKAEPGRTARRVRIHVRSRAL
jgi:ribosomal protein L10